MRTGGHRGRRPRRIPHGHFRLAETRQPTGWRERKCTQLGGRRGGLWRCFRPIFAVIAKGSRKLGIRVLASPIQTREQRGEQCNFAFKIHI
jgi:hypothetical protein